MNRTEKAIHDLSVAFANLGAQVPGKVELFEKSLNSLVRFALSEDKLAPIMRAREDMLRVESILKSSKGT